MLNHVNFTPFPLPDRNEHTWTPDELNSLDSRVGSALHDAEFVSGITQLLTGRGLIGAVVVAEILNQGIKTDEYDTTGMRFINILNAASAVGADADRIPAGAGVITNNAQP